MPKRFAEADAQIVVRISSAMLKAIREASRERRRTTGDYVSNSEIVREFIQRGLDGLRPASPPSPSPSLRKTGS